MRRIQQESGEEENTRTEELLYLPMHRPPPATPHPFPWRHYTGDVRDKQADRCSPMSKQPVCAVSAWRRHRTLRISRWRWVSSKRARHGWRPCRGRGEEGSVGRGEQPQLLTSTGQVCPAGHWLVFLWVRIRFWMWTWIFSVGHQLHHLVLASQKTNCPRFSFSLFVLVGFVNSWHALGLWWGFRCPFRFYFVFSCGILGLLLERYHLIHEWPSTVHVTAVL